MSFRLTRLMLTGWEPSIRFGCSLVFPNVERISRRLLSDGTVLTGTKGGLRIILFFSVGILAIVQACAVGACQGTGGAGGTGSPSSQGRVSLEATAEYLAALKAFELGSYDVAAEGFRVFIQKHPQDARIAEAFFRLGLCEFHLRHFPQAAEAFSQAASRSADRQFQEDAKFNQGMSLLAGAQQGMPNLSEAAVSTFEEFLRLYPKSARRGEVAYCLGEAWYILGRKDRAIESYQEALKANVQGVQRANTLYSLGVCLEEVDKSTEAVGIYEAFLRDFANDSRASHVAVALGDILFRQKRFEDAQKYYLRAASLNDPELAPYALLRVADSAAATGQLPEAVRRYREVQEKFPNSEYSARAALEAGRALRRLQQWSEAIEQFRKAAQHKAVAEEATILMAETWVDSGQVQEALREIEQLRPAVVSPAGKVRLELLQAEVLAKQESRKSEALAAFRRLADGQIDPSVKNDAAFRTANLALELNDSKLARQYATQFIESNPQDPRVPFATYIFAESFLLENDLGQADRIYSSILTKYPADRPITEAARVRKLWVVYLQGNYADVINRVPTEVRAVSKPALAAEIYYLGGMSNFHLKQFGEASTAFSQALKLDPNFRLAPETRLYLGRTFLEMKQLEKASQLLQELLAGNLPSLVSQEAQFWLAEVDYQSGRKADAVRRYEELLPQVQNPDLAARVRFALASVLAEEGHAERALVHLNDLLTKFPEHPLRVSARLHRARVLWALQRVPELVRDMENLLTESLPPSAEAEAKYLLAIGYVELKDSGKAIPLLEALRQAKSSNISAEDILYQLGLAYELAGRKDAAKSVFQELGAKAKESSLPAEALYHLGEYLFGAGAYQEASSVFYQVLQRVKGPREADLAEKAAHRLGWCLFQMGDFSKAEGYFAYQLQRFRDGNLAGDGYFLLGECFLQRGKALHKGTEGPSMLVSEGKISNEAQQLYQSAWENFRQAIEHPKGLTRPEYYWLAVLRAAEAAGQLGNWQESRRLLEGGRERFATSPYLPELLCSLGWTYWKLGDPEKARATLQEAVQVAEKSEQTPREVGARARFLLGEVYFHNKSYRDAIREFLVVAYGYGYPAWQIAGLFEAARCYEEQNRQAEALKCYQEIVKNFSDSKDPKVALARQKVETLSRAAPEGRQ